MIAMQQVKSANAEYLQRRYVQAVEQAMRQAETTERNRQFDEMCRNPKTAFGMLNEYGADIAKWDGNIHFSFDQDYPSLILNKWQALQLAKEITALAESL